MRYLYTLTLALAFVFSVNAAFPQSTTNPLAPNEWNASWIEAPNVPGTTYGVYYFRKSIDLTVKPATFIIHVSADNRYKL